MELEFISRINIHFNQIRNHSNFMVRERVYKGGLYQTQGLASQHEQFLALKRRIEDYPIPTLYLEHNASRLNKIVDDLVESIDIFVTIIEGGYSKIEIVKFLQVTKFELLELIKFVEEGYSFNESMIMSKEDLDKEKRQELLAKIEDNFNQITSSYAWRELESKLSLTVVGEVRILKYKKIIEQTIELSLKITSIDYLLLMSIVAMKIRSQMAESPNRLTEYLEFFQALSKIFSEEAEKNFNYSFNNQQLTSNDLKQDIEHKINTSKLNWLVSLYRFVAEEGEENLEQLFASKLFELSRDPKAEFLWTMIKIAKEQRNEELEVVSINYANMATNLLSMNYELKEKGYGELADSVRQIDEITALDAISDIGELYNSKEVNLDHMINAIRKQLNNLKEYAYKISEIENLRDPFQKIISITDFDVKFSEEYTLENYLDGL